MCGRRTRQRISPPGRKPPWPCRQSQRSAKNRRPAGNRFRLRDNVIRDGAAGRINCDDVITDRRTQTSSHSAPAPRAEPEESPLPCRSFKRWKALPISAALTRSSSPSSRSRSARRSSAPSRPRAVISASSLGVVELTIALHRLLESPRDRIVWDTGHQAYPHKLLTGRIDQFPTLRQLGGIGGFPRRSESPHDVFDGGHAGTGLSIAEGLAEARDLRHGMERIAVVVGDAALMSGLSLEALNDIGHRQTQMLIVVNDNEMSISPTVGAFSRYLSQIKLSRAWHHSKSAYDRTVERIPVVGGSVLELSKRFRASVVRFAQPGQLFEDLGITYIGVVPGHDLHALLETLGRALRLPGPTIVHVRTHKGRGYRPAEADQIGFHGAALPPMTMVPAGRPAMSASTRCRPSR